MSLNSSAILLMKQSSLSISLHNQLCFEVIGNQICRKRSKFKSQGKMCLFSLWLFFKWRLWKELTHINCPSSFHCQFSSLGITRKKAFSCFTFELAFSPIPVINKLVEKQKSVHVPGEIKRVTATLSELLSFDYKVFCNSVMCIYS